MIAHIPVYDTGLVIVRSWVEALLDVKLSNILRQVVPTCVAEQYNLVPAIRR